MSTMHVQFPLQGPISRVADGKELHEGMKAAILLITDDLLLETDHTRFNYKLRLDDTAGNHLAEGVIPDEVLKEKGEDELVVAWYCWLEDEVEGEGGFGIYLDPLHTLLPSHCIFDQFFLKRSSSEGWRHGLSSLSHRITHTAPQ